MSSKHGYKNKTHSKRLYPALRNDVYGSSYGYISYNGKFIIKAKYESADNFNEFEIAIVQEKNLTGGINTRGEYVIKPIYDSINSFKGNRAVYVLDGSMGVMDPKGNRVTSKKYDFISDYAEERAVVGTNDSTGTYFYGYIDEEGNEIIPPKFLQANDFIDGVALVKINEERYGLIDKNGNVINTYNYGIVSQYGDGLMVFANSFEGPFGYINKEGQEVIKPIFKEAQGFKGGVAVVSSEDAYNGPYGLIDLKGTYVYQSIYSKINYLGEGRVALGLPIGDDKFISSSIYAIGDTTGKRFTDFKYLVVGDYNKELAYASDNQYTFFIDKSGNIKRRFPVVRGSGDLEVKDNIIFANIDYCPYYLTKEGIIIYKPNNTIRLSKKYSISKIKYKPNINYLIYNPKVNNVANKKVEKNINKKLIKMSYFKPLFEENVKEPYIVKPEDVLNYSYYGDFKVEFFKKNLLVLDLVGYYYPFGAAHGMPTKKTPSINLVTGKVYTLGDLFMGGVYWVGELNKIIENMIKTDPQYEYVYKDGFKGINEEQSFYIDEENLYIYFPPYEIGPYAAGFVTFKIPLEEIQGMINKRGEFYKSFN
jgi:hypothetical protein